MRAPAIPEIEIAIDALIAAEQDALDCTAHAKAFAPLAEVWRRSERRLILALRGRTEAYFYRGYRWQVDPHGELTKFPDDSVLKHVEQGRVFNKPRTNNRRIV